MAPTTRQDIRSWFDDGVAQNATHMIVVCDTFDHEDYPVYVYPGQDVRATYDEHNGKNMQRVMEVYHLGSSQEKQLQEHRAFNFAPLKEDLTTEPGVATISPGPRPGFQPSGTQRWVASSQGAT